MRDECASRRRPKPVLLVVLVFGSIIRAHDFASATLTTAVAKNFCSPSGEDKIRSALSAGREEVYSANSRQSRLKEGCGSSPARRFWCRKVERRVVDLLLPFRGFRYYHPAQCGSASMKDVLPTLTERGYGHLAIQEGDNTASQECLRVHFGDVPETEPQRVRRHLEEYCEQDTVGMIWIVEAVERMCR
ncbi:MAG: hypothetical protein ACYDH9_04215 [Limisphaerales bacterium]